MIKAIETVYENYKFRSRLEARWAVFFNVLGVSWEYELEGFELQRQWYLPDFWLNDFKCWVEIKPLNDWNVKDPYYYKSPIYDLMKDFASDIDPIICFGGVPTLGWNGMLFCNDLTDSSGGSYENRVGFSWCNICQKVSISLSDEDSRFINGGRTLHLPDWSRWDTFCDPEHRKSHSIGPLERATAAALQARFEHGQNGP